MKRFGKVLMAVAALLVTGCAASVPGRASSPVLPDAETPTYANDLDSGDRAFVNQMAALRMLDLCGYFDLPTLSRLGSVGKPDATLAATGCAVDINANVSGQLIQVDSDLVPSALRGKWGVTRIDLDGNAVYERSRQHPRFDDIESYSTCDHFMPFAAGYDLRISIFQEGMVPLCDTLASITRAALTHFTDKPLRQNSDFQAFHAATVSDPCLAAAEIADGDNVDVDVNSSGIDKCTFHVAGRSWATVQLSYTLNDFGSYPANARFVVEGMPATRLVLNDVCEVTIHTGDPHDGQHYDRVVGFESAEMVSSVIATAETCDGAEEAARAGARVFLEGV